MASFSKKKKLNMSGKLEVEGNDDLLMVILVHMPARSILRFRCVSKRWDYTVSAPFFLQTFYNFRKELALAHKMVAYIKETHVKSCPDNSRCRMSESTTIVPVSYDGQKLFHTQVNVRGSSYINSSNGLIFLQTRKFTFYIFNPIMDSGYKLIRPEKTRFYHQPAMAMVCEKNTHDLVLNFKVVFAAKREEEHSYFTIHTFCSKTSEWMISIPTATGSPDDILHRFSLPFVVDDVIYWFTDTRLYLVVYYMASNTIQIVEIPSECGNNYSSRVTRSSCEDDLWLCVHMAKSCCIKCWMISRAQYDSYKLRSVTIPSNAWVLMHEFKYHIPNAPAPVLATPAPIPITHVPAPSCKKEFLLKKCVSSPWWRGGNPRKVPPYVHYYITKHCDPAIYARYDFHPYMEALTLSAYSSSTLSD